MSELIEKSVELIEKSSRGVLLTLDEKSEIHGRPIGAFGNDGVNLIFATRKATKKVTHIKIHPKVTFYIENAGTGFGEFNLYYAKFSNPLRLEMDSILLQIVRYYL